MSNRHANYNHHPTWATRSFNRQLEYESSLPTSRQKKFIAVLQIKIREAGLKCDAKAADFSRTAYANLITELVEFCKEHNIELDRK